MMATNITMNRIGNLCVFLSLVMISSVYGQHRYRMQNDMAAVGSDDNSTLQSTSSVSARHCARLCSADLQCKAANYDDNSSTCQLMADVLSQAEDKSGNIAIGE